MVDCCSTPGLTPLADALKQLQASIETKDLAVEHVAIEASHGRILAQDVTSQFSIPHADNSAMDGYALRADDSQTDQALEIIATVFAGHPYAGEIQQGQCVRIMTGGDIPAGADAVIMQENAEASKHSVRFIKPASKGENIRPQGEDIAKGDCVLARGRRLTSADIGLLASLGLSQVSVSRKLKVAVISTGDELKKPGEALAAGQFYESNGFSTAALLERWGAQVIQFGIVPDDLDKLRKAFTEADKIADVVVTSGGVSVGEADYCKMVIEELGRIDFWKLAIKPGKPFAFGQLPNSYFIGLPGNPVSAMVTLHQLGIPLMENLQGETSKPRLRLKAKTSGALRKRPGRTDFQRGVYHTDESGDVWVQATGGQGSGLLTSLSYANCYIVLEQDRGHVSEHEVVTIEPFDGLLNGY